MKKDGAGCFVIQKSLLTLTSSKILSLDNSKKKRVSFWYCPRLIVPLTFVERQRVGDGTSGMDTFARQFKKNEFLFGIVLA